MAKIVTVDQMRIIERAVDASGTTYEMMMENAGRALADAIIARWPDVQEKHIAILVGSGNNGGDGLVAGYHLIKAGAEVSAYLTSGRTDEDLNFLRLREHGGHIMFAEQDQRSTALRKVIKAADIVIDGVLGTGIKLPLRGNAQRVLSNAKRALENREPLPIIIGVDCPSGLDCDTGEIADESLASVLTVTFGAVKPGLIRFPGADKVGELVVADIGIPKNLKEVAKVELELATADMVREWLPRRPKNAHKGTFGRALIVAGSINYPGAAMLAGVSAYRVGVGLVTMAVPAPIQSMIVPQFPEATWIVLPHEIGVIAEGAHEIVAKELDQSQAVLLGPGFGQEEQTAAFMNRLLGFEGGRMRGRIGFIHGDEKGHAPGKLDLPCVIDADGLKLLTQIPKWASILPENTVLTPHPGEMAALTEQTKEEIQSDRTACAQRWAKEWGHVVVLKGAFSVVAAPDGRTTVLPFATPALARAGTGDVLAGAIVGLRAQGVEAFEAAVLGAYLQGRAGELAARRVGATASVLAGDVADALPLAIAELLSDGG
jgi:hydroxyethylthiazole kinase-like uncharacterized protein yjeF